MRNDSAPGNAHHSHDLALPNPLTTPANALTRAASVALAASRSSSPAKVLSAPARRVPLICSALFNALAIADVRAAGSPLPRTS